MIAIAMLSLAGLPPLPGFVAKFLIFRNVIGAGYTLYGVLGLVGSYLGIYFYLRVIQHLFMSADAPAPSASSAHAALRVTKSGTSLAVIASVICLLLAILVSVFPGWVIGNL
jgi:NADH-quinone oxidoreductase subunit N